MADVNPPNRPLSPFMIGQVYRPQITSVLSILHRVAGVGLTLAAILVVWWLLALGAGPESFSFVDGLLTSWIGGLILIGSLAAFWYHFCNGIRHLFWDAGYGFDLPTVHKSGKAVVAATVVLTILTLILAF
ncbi:MAG: succinate dehydrogenase, cytochrome b556 subunit [Rhodovulum sulfidophilum]|uniref:Succinate dehydrogenase cytochrome b556 subunit n=1 Tax=Rhodovulum sulfidophilum TaxID=35806 RepID=A0A2W5NGW8_RHOSU|nr:MAG: succinate dehydrogenase, cytochrome b556 subunit [Rhodovulum sulfidophilum]